MEYTNQQRAAFKDAYAKRFRKQLIMLVLVFAAMAALAITSERATLFGLPAAVAGPISFVVVVLCWWIFEIRNWCCPACDKYLGRAFNPKRCRSCGIELRRTKSDSVR
ncbi:MAG TPA: hypothetical protein VEC56_08255 [Candidatus Krumholzibacteria bacterium]|nr:hypothetical protein [Candidatus Krumholzibacteria bacterium]